MLFIISHNCVMRHGEISAPLSLLEVQDIWAGGVTNHRGKCTL